MSEFHPRRRRPDLTQRSRSLPPRVTFVLLVLVFTGVAPRLAHVAGAGTATLPLTATQPHTWTQTSSPTITTVPTVTRSFSGNTFSQGSRTISAPLTSTKTINTVTESALTKSGRTVSPSARTVTDTKTLQATSTVTFTQSDNTITLRTRSWTGTDATDSKSRSATFTNTRTPADTLTHEATMTRSPQTESHTFSKSANTFSGSFSLPATPSLSHTVTYSVSDTLTYVPTWSVTHSTSRSPDLLVTLVAVPSSILRSSVRTLPGNPFADTAKQRADSAADPKAPAGVPGRTIRLDAYGGDFDPSVFEGHQAALNPAGTPAPGEETLTAEQKYQKWLLTLRDEQEFYWRHMSVKVVTKGDEDESLAMTKNLGKIFPWATLGSIWLGAAENNPALNQGLQDSNAVSPDSTTTAPAPPPVDFTTASQRAHIAIMDNRIPSPLPSSVHGNVSAARKAGSKTYALVTIPHMPWYFATYGETLELEFSADLFVGRLRGAVARFSIQADPSDPDLGVRVIKPDGLAQGLQMGASLASAASALGKTAATSVLVAPWGASLLDLASCDFKEGEEPLPWYEHPAMIPIPSEVPVGIPIAGPYRFRYHAGCCIMNTGILFCVVMAHLAVSQYVGESDEEEEQEGRNRRKRRRRGLQPLSRAATCFSHFKAGMIRCCFPNLSILFALWLWQPTIRSSLIVSLYMAPDSNTIDSAWITQIKAGCIAILTVWLLMTLLIAAWVVVRFGGLFVLRPAIVNGNNNANMKNNATGGGVGNAENGGGQTPQQLQHQQKSDDIFTSLGIPLSKDSDEDDILDGDDEYEEDEDLLEEEKCCSCGGRGFLDYFFVPKGHWEDDTFFVPAAPAVPPNGDTATSSVKLRNSRRKKQREHEEAVHGFCSKYGCLFVLYRSKRHWFFVVELLTCFLFAVARAARPRSFDCTIIHSISLCILVILFFMVVLLRPYNTPFTLVWVVAVLLLCCVAQILLLAATQTEVTEGDADAKRNAKRTASWLFFAATCVVAISSMIQIGILLWQFCQRRKVIREKRLVAEEKKALQRFKRGFDGGDGEDDIELEIKKQQDAETKKSTMLSLLWDDSDGSDHTTGGAKSTTRGATTTAASRKRTNQELRKQLLNSPLRSASAQRRHPENGGKATPSNPLAKQMRRKDIPVRDENSYPGLNSSPDESGESSNDSDVATARHKKTVGKANGPVGVQHHYSTLNRRDRKKLQNQNQHQLVVPQLDPHQQQQQHYHQYQHQYSQPPPFGAGPQFYPPQHHQPPAWYPPGSGGGVVGGRYGDDDDEDDQQQQRSHRHSSARRQRGGDTGGRSPPRRSRRAMNDDDDGEDDDPDRGRSRRHDVRVGASRREDKSSNRQQKTPPPVAGATTSSGKKKNEDPLPPHLDNDIPMPPPAFNQETALDAL